jgi:pimeloyl-ACP methyl ester carboxylesterase
MAAFVLGHGGFGGAWVWDLLRPEIEKLGYTTSAVDLLIDELTGSLLDYRDAVLAGISEVADNLIVVGHSQGGLSLDVVLVTGEDVVAEVDGADDEMGVYDI